MSGFKAAVAGCTALALMAGAAHAATKVKPARPDLTGMWEMHMLEYLKMDDGKLPPMKPEALKLYEMKTTRMKAGQQIPDSATSCLPHGMPRIMYTPFPMQVIQRPEMVGFLYEVNHNQRIVYMDQKPVEDPDPSYMGSSVGHWEGATLVVDTIGFNDKIQIDRAGLPQSPDAKIQERLRLIDGGKRMEDKITVTDPANYTAPWSYTVYFTKVGYRLMEYVCDNNRDAIRIKE